jgi:hypothetical protein
MRSLRVQLNGYEFCKNAPHPVLREKRSELHKARCIDAYPLIETCEFFAPNAKVRAKIGEIRRDYHRLLGEPTVRQQVMSRYAFLKACLYKMETVVGRPPPGEPPLRRYEYDRKPRGSLERPYKTVYPRRDERYEHQKRVHENEMRLLDRVVELLEQGKPLGEAEPAVRRIHHVFENMEAIGHAAKLVDELGDGVGLSKGWLRSEVLKGMESVTAKLPEETVEARNLQ